jgi:hypothetical protein
MIHASALLMSWLSARQKNEMPALPGGRSKL